MKNLYKALLQVQSQVETLPKTKQAHGYRFTPLDVILDYLRPKLKEAGLVVLQTVEDVDGAVAVKTTVIHAESGEKMEALAVAPKERGNIRMSPVQAMGSDITYLRRYSISPIFGIASDEDVDGDYLDKSKPQKQAPKEPSTADLSKFLSYADAEAGKATDAEVFSGLRGEAEQAFGKPLPKEISSHLMELYTKFTQKSEVKGE